MATPTRLKSLKEDKLIQVKIKTGDFFSDTRVDLSSRRLRSNSTRYNFKNVLYSFIILSYYNCTKTHNKNTFSSNLKEDLTSKANVSLLTSRDDGQMSTSTAAPFSMLSIRPHTNPHTHMYLKILKH